MFGPATGEQSGYQQRGRRDENLPNGDIKRPAVPRRTSSRKSEPKPKSENGEVVPSADAITELSAEKLSVHNSIEELKTLNRIVVRVEVHDTGVGIRARDLIDNKLFR